MQLHRSSSQAEWSGIAPEHLNFWQRQASRSDGVFTPGNVITMAGVALCVAGLWLLLGHDYWLGLGLIAVGRFFDVLDGLAADKTGTKSPLGESLDAGFDKLVSLAAFIVFMAAHIISVPVAALLFVPNFLSSVATLLTDRRGIRLHPALAGKWSMAANWLALGCFAIVAAAGLPEHAWLYYAGLLLTIISFVLGMAAASKYYRVLLGKLKSADL